MRLIQGHTAIAKLLIEKGAKLDEKSYVSTTWRNGDVDKKLEWRFMQTLIFVSKADADADAVSVLFRVVPAVLQSTMPF